MRLRHFILGAVCIFACSKAGERLRSRSEPLVVLEADGNFGTQPVTTTSAPRMFVVRPAPPSDSLQFDRIESVQSTCAEFLVDAPNAAGAIVQRSCTAFAGGDTYGGGGETVCVAFAERTYPFTVRFAPTQQGATSDQCKVIVRLDGGGKREVQVSGFGIPPPLSASISPREEINFFTVNLGATTTPPRLIEVKNTGSNNLTVSATTDLAGGVFSTGPAPTASHQLAPGASTVYQVTCTPPTATLFTGSIRIMTSDPDPNDASVLIPFKCQGIDHPISNTDGTFTQVLVGNTATVSVTLLNQTTATLTGVAVELAQPAVDGVSIKTPPASTLAPGDDTEVELTWTPSEPYNGGLGGLVLKVGGEDDRPIGSAMGHATIADVKASIPTTEKVDFGRLCIGESKTLSFSMVPGGDSSDVFANYTVTSATATMPFTADVVGGPAPVEVTTPPTVATVAVTAMPMISDGLFEGTVTVSTNSPSEPTYDVGTIVQVLQGGTTVNPPLLNFREVIVTGFSETKTATFTNCTADTIEITGVALDGNSATDFDIIQIMPNGVEQLPPFSLPRGGEILIAVQMLPQSDGTKEAQVTIDFQEPGKPQTSAETVALLGEGFIKTPDRDSYYRCSTGAPLGLVPLGLALGFIIRRRRRR